MQLSEPTRAYGYHTWPISIADYINLLLKIHSFRKERQGKPDLTPYRFIHYGIHPAAEASPGLLLLFHASAH